MRIGQYEVLSKVGATAMSTVFRGRADDGRMVAMKVLRSIAPSARERFERELRLMQTLGEEAGFVPCLEVVESKQGPVLVMPFVPGGTLRVKLANGPLDVESVVALGRALAAALARAHEKGIVHRDVKPENVLFTADGRPLLGDLGIAKHFREDTPGASQSYELTRSNTFLGTVCYMPAEQIQNAKNAGPPADVFALAAVLYECLAGEPAYLAPNAIETLRRVLKEDLDPLSRRAPATPPWLAQVIERALARDPRKRYPDARAFAKALAPPRRSAPIVPLLLGGATLIAVGGPLALWIATRRPPAPPPPPPPPVKPEIALVATSAPATPRRPAYEAPEFAKGFARSTKVTLTRVFGDTALHYHGTVGYLAVAPDGKRVLTANERGELVVWDLEKGEESVQPPCPFGQWALGWGAAGPRALDLDWRELRLWTPEDPELRVLDSAKEGYFTGTLTADAEHALVATPSGRVDVIQLATARRTQTLVSSMDEAIGPLRPLALDWKHRRAFAGASHGKIHVFDLTRERETGKSRATTTPCSSRP